MTNSKPQGASAAMIFGALLLLLVVAPAGVSLARGDGAVCFTDAACPLSSLNPCVRKPSFALVGRCEVAIK